MVAAERFGQRRADVRGEGVGIGDFDAGAGERELHAARDPDARIDKRAVEIEQDRVVPHVIGSSVDGSASSMPVNPTPRRKPAGRYAVISSKLGMTGSNSHSSSAGSTGVGVPIGRSSS